MLVVALVVLGLSAASPASPEDRLAQAQASLEALKLEEAEHSLEGLVSDPAASESVRARAWLALGLTRASLLDDDGARVAFAAALAIDGSLALPAESSPKVQRLFDKTKARLPPSPPPATTTAPATPPTATAPNARTPTATTATTATTGTTPATTAPNAGGARDAQGAGTQPPAESMGLPLTITGGLLLAVAVGAGVGALVADDSLARPQAGRSRNEYESIRDLGIAAVVGAGVLGAGGAVALGFGLMQ